MQPETYITARDLRVLEHLENSLERHTPSSLAAFTGQAKITAARQMSALIRRGLVVRHHWPSPRYCIWYEITDAGREVIRRAQAGSLEIIAMRKEIAEVPETLDPPEYQPIEDDDDPY